MALVGKTLMMGLGLTIAAAAAAAGEGKDKPIKERRQARLMERFGDEGIDANGDGTLTRAEVRAFHEAKGQQEGQRGFRGGPGRGRGHGGPLEGPGGRLGQLLQELETLRSQTPPPWFTVERFEDADVDEDGAFSAEEWTTFAKDREADVVEQILSMGPTADVDQDGKLSEPELGALKDAHMARMRGQILKRHPELDSDGDGTLSDAEFEAVKTAHLSKILERHPEADLNKDGVLSEEEAKAFAMDRPERHRGPHSMRSRGPAGHGKVPGGPNRPPTDKAP